MEAARSSPKAHRKQIAENEKSFTGHYLKAMLRSQAHHGLSDVESA